MFAKAYLRNTFRLVVLALFLLGSFCTAYAAGRIAVRGHHGAVASSSMIASEIGVDVMRQGGNAIDAAVATALAMAVTWPTAGNIGGGGFLIYHGADGTATAIDFREKAPLAATEDMYLGADGKVPDNINHEGILAVGVPGTVAGLVLAHERLGSLPWEDLVTPAIKLARDGFPLTFKLRDDFKSRMHRFEKYPSSQKTFTNSDGGHYEAGDIWVQSDLADTLERIQNDKHDGFYAGKTAELITRFMADNGGIITLEDLSKYRAVERAPIRGNYRGYEIVSMPPPSSGGVTMVEMLNILEGFDLGEIGHNSALYLHLLVESMRRAYADRANFLGDPDFNEDMPLDRLTSKAHAENLRETIDMDRASASDPAKFAQIYESPDTTHFSVVDQHGNMVSLTYTLEWGYGSHIVVAGAGFLLNNEMGDFNARPGVTNEAGWIGTVANRIRPEQRMLSSMSPTIVAVDGVPLFATGTPGGKTIINTTMQTILNVIDHGMTIAEAVEAPRIHHQWLPDRTRIERLGFSKDTLEKFQGLGHTVRATDTIGSAMAVYRDPESGEIAGAADSRAEDGGVAVW